jgi:hypothetical protein
MPFVFRFNSPPLAALDVGMRHLSIMFYAIVVGRIVTFYRRLGARYVDGPFPMKPLTKPCALLAIGILPYLLNAEAL